MGARGRVYIRTPTERPDLHRTSRCQPCLFTDECGAAERRASRKTQPMSSNAELCTPLLSYARHATEYPRCRSQESFRRHAGPRVLRAVLEVKIAPTWLISGWAWPTTLQIGGFGTKCGQHQAEFANEAVANLVGSGPGLADIAPKLNTRHSGAAQSAFQGNHRSAAKGGPKSAKM